ncbi:MAG: D-alanyl-D-alanine carboxypeptidase/D-alanyl-D-alanine-endopeptidase [Flavobacteriales bacterium]|nr:D-alanyl-D-alanine carboxypeptidase/D-alanyl-D-alanine-endopeptidase [Flavobacteriales bacterium]
MTSKLKQSLLLSAIFVLIIAKTLAQGDIPTQFDKVLKDERLKGAWVSACFLDQRTGEPIFEHNADMIMTPASSLKSLTTHAALEILSPEYQFNTELLTSGEISPDGTLTGDLIIRGYGDPTLGSPNFYKDRFKQEWLLALKNAGIKRVTGFVVVDDMYFEGPPLAGSTAIEDGGNYYAPGVHGINVYDNTCKLFFSSPEEAGKQTGMVKVDPELPAVKFQNYVQSSDEKGDNAYIFGQPLDYVRAIYGTIPKNRKSFEIKGSISDPALVLGRDFEALCELKGIVVEKGYKVLRRIETYPNQNVIATTLSPKLSEIVYLTNRKSINLYAAALVKHVGMQERGIGSYEAGAEVIKEYWREFGIDVTGLQIEDGSGLSRTNFVTAKQLARTAGYVSKKSEEAFHNSLRPYAGRSKLLVKSGYIERVRSFTGRVTLTDGTEASFSVILNNFNCTASQSRQILEGFLKAITQP